MQSRAVPHPGRMFVLIFESGDELIAGVRDFAQAQGVTAGRFTALGAFSHATLAYFNWNTKQYQDIPIDDQVEVLSLIGTVSQMDDRTKIHAHGVVGRPDGSTRGGHVKAGYVRPTLEVVLTEMPTTLVRTRDAESGLNLIDLVANAPGG